MGKAPWTDKEVQILNWNQQNGQGHPFTCGGKNAPSCLRNKSYEDRHNGIPVPYTSNNEGILIATNTGWVCPCGEYTQDWAGDGMFVQQKDPFKKIWRKGKIKDINNDETI